VQQLESRYFLEQQIVQTIRKSLLSRAEVQTNKKWAVRLGFVTSSGPSQLTNQANTVCMRESQSYERPVQMRFYALALDVLKLLALLSNTLLSLTWRLREARQIKRALHLWGRGANTEGVPPPFPLTVDRDPVRNGRTSPRQVPRPTGTVTCTKSPGRAPDALTPPIPVVPD